MTVSHKQSHAAQATVEHDDFNTNDAPGALSSQGLAAYAQDSDRRVSPRVSYPYVQWVAPSGDGKMPPRREFREVRCRDISAGGFCYLAETAPEHKTVVISLGPAAGLTCLAAEVAQVTPVEYEGQQ